VVVADRQTPFSWPNWSHCSGSFAIIHFYVFMYWQSREILHMYLYIPSSICLSVYQSSIYQSSVIYLPVICLQRRSPTH
jgi:hypothetical protein